MYIEIVPNRTSPPAILLRESFRDGDQIRKRTLANLSHWEPARVEALRRALRGDFDHLTGEDPGLSTCVETLPCPISMRSHNKTASKHRIRE